MRAIWPLALLIALPLLSLRPQGIAAAEFDPQSLVGSRVTVEMRSGDVLAGWKLVKIGRGKIRDSVASLTVSDPKGGSQRTIAAASIHAVSDASGKERLSLDEGRGVLVAAGASPSSSAAGGKKPSASATPSTKTPSGGKPGAKGKTPPETPEEAEQHRLEREAERKALQAKLGIRLWPELSEAQQEAVVQEQKAFLDKVAEKAPPGSMVLYETKRFLFYTDLSPRYVFLYTPYLDAMYKGLCGAFGLDPEKNIWRGKAVIVAFAKESAFQAFETAFFPDTDQSKPAQGRAHEKGNGDVVISCWLGSNPLFFACVLVHETAHGFMFRYKSSEHIPSWLDEGAADWIAGKSIPKEDEVPRRQAEAIARMRKTRSMGGDFFTAEQIAGWQYGIASSMTEFLLRTDQARYRKLIEGIKLGTNWQQSLKDAYGWTPEELALRYGMAVGIPGLRP